MNGKTLKISDYLFMQFRTLTPTLEQVCEVYYPHLSRTKVLEKGRKMEFPFVCFKIDNSQKSPYLVDILDLGFVLEKNYKEQAEEFNKFHQKNHPKIQA